MKSLFVLGFFITKTALADHMCTSVKGEKMHIKDVAQDQIALTVTQNGVQKSFSGKLNLEASDLASQFQKFDYILKGARPAHLVLTVSPSFGGGRGGPSRVSYNSFLKKFAKLTIGTEVENYNCY